MPKMDAVEPRRHTDLKDSALPSLTVSSTLKVDANRDNPKMLMVLPNLKKDRSEVADPITT
jgi:hypothetical protein